MERQEWMGGNGSSITERLDGFRKQLLIVQFFLSITGILGNVILAVTTIKMHHRKTFEIFLFGLATSNLVMLVNVEVYDVTLLFYSQSWSLPLNHCSAVRFLKVFGFAASMYFTVLICAYRYQKLRDAGTRGQMPVLLDNILVACAASWVGMLLAAILAIPTFFIDLDVYSGNVSCSMDIFHCFQEVCPVAHVAYKYAFLLTLTFLPFIIVTGCSCLILRIILHQQKLIHDHEVDEDVHHHTQNHHPHHHHHHNLHKSTIAILAAMGVCQVTWTSYLTLYLAFDPYTFQFWPETEFYITALYATISPFVYGIGNNYFSLNHCIR